MRVLVLTACLSSLFITGASAQGSARTLTLQAAIAEALARNPELVALDLEQQSDRASATRDRHLVPPMLEAEVWGWPVTTLNPARTEMYMLTAQQQFPGPGKRAARVLVAEREVDVSRQEQTSRASQVVAAVREAYVDLAFARDSFAIFERQAALLEDLAEVATLRYAAGQGPQSETVTTLVEVTAIERDRIVADQRAQSAEARLNNLLGRPAAQPVEPLESPATLEAAHDAEPLVAQHPEVLMADAVIAREEAELARLRGERRPDFMVGGGYMLKPGEAGAWTARVGLTWPNAPWSRSGLTEAAAAQAKRVEAARARREAALAHVRHAVREAAIRVTAAERQLRLIESTLLPQTEHVFELARVAYVGTEGSFADVLQARRQFLAVQLDYLNARAELARARAGVHAAAGAL